MSADSKAVPSLAMQMGINSGHVTCPKCKTFMHVEILEGNQAWTEAWAAWIQRQRVDAAPRIA